jgi:hypothetical protein
MSVIIPCAVTVEIPRKVLDEYAAAVRRRETGNFVIHLRVGEPLGITFERNVSLDSKDRQDLIVLR